MITMDGALSNHLSFAEIAFPKANYISCIKKMKLELEELEKEVHPADGSQPDRKKVLEEFADVILCIVTAADRLGISSSELAHAMNGKTVINRSRRWLLNIDNTYSHIKD